MEQHSLYKIIMTHKRKKTPSLVIIIILTTLTIFSWIFYEVYGVIKSESPSNVPENILIPFSPIIDIDQIRSLNERLYFDDEFLKYNLPTASVSAILLQDGNLSFNPDETMLLTHIGDLFVNRQL